MTKITKTLTALAAAATIGLAAVATPQPAEARNGGAIAAGIIGGLAVGALIGAAANGPYYGYGPGYYAAGPALRIRWLLLDPSARLGRMGLALPPRAGLRLRPSQIGQSERMKKESPDSVSVSGLFFETRSGPALNKFPTYWNRLYLGTGTRISLNSLFAVGAADLTWRELL